MSYPNDQSNPAAATPVWIAPPPAAAGQAQRNIAANGNTLVKDGPGVFLGLTVNTPGVGSTAKVYDGIDATGTLLGTFSTVAQNTVYPPGGFRCETGIFVVTAGGTPADITVSYY